MRYPAVNWDRRKRGFLCPDCMEPVQVQISEDGIRYTVNADANVFPVENKKNRICSNCGGVLWAPVNPGRNIPWTKISGFGWVYKPFAAAYMERTKNEAILGRLREIAEHPDEQYPVAGARRRFPLSTCIKKKYRGRIDGLLCDELHEYNNNSGQGDAMGELFGVSKQFVDMTATLINGYSSGIFHLLYRIVPALMRKDGKACRCPRDFDAEYGVAENVYEIKDEVYNSNRRTNKRKQKTKHPYATFNERTGYYGVYKERNDFYQRRDMRSQFQQGKEFLRMFNDYDREQARLWLEKNFPPQSSDEIFRDTGGSLFCSVIRMAAENGD